MSKFRKIFLAFLCALVAGCLIGFAGCIEPAGKYVTDIIRSETDTDTVFTIIYSDNTETELSVPKGDGKDGKDGEDGQDGRDGKDLTVDSVYEKYQELYGDMSYADFLKEYLPELYYENNYCVGEIVLSAMKIHCEFIEETTSFFYRYDTAMSSGSAVIWSMSTGDNGYTYIVTNYHVVYEYGAVEQYNGGTKLARKITAYVFGSETKPAIMDQKDENGYTQYNYGSDFIECEYVGGSINADIAVVRAKTSDILAVNSAMRPVTLAEGYRLGEKAIAVGNAENYGLSVTQGIISVVDEIMDLKIDNTTRHYRSLRIDTPIYEGNSGGGLFNAAGELIGITNAGHRSDQNINYAIPLETVTSMVENIIYYYSDGKASTVGAYRMLFGIEISESNLKYVYDEAKGSGLSYADIVVMKVDSKSSAERQSIAAGDILKAIIINGERYELRRQSDMLILGLNMRANQFVKIEYERGGELHTTSGEYLDFNDFALYE